MSIPNQLIYSASVTDNLSYKSLGLKSLHVQDLTVNSQPLLFNRFDSTIQVNTYDGADNLVTADVFSVNVHGSLVGHAITITIAAMAYTAPGAFNYFGFQLPTGFIPNTLNSSLYLVTKNGTVAASKYAVSTSGIVKIFGTIAAANFANTDTFASPEQSIIFSNAN